MVRVLTRAGCPMVKRVLAQKAATSILEAALWETQRDIQGKGGTMTWDDITTFRPGKGPGQNYFQDSSSSTLLPESRLQL
eukprot:7198409-Heterocapsa_arctica.AAC.1